MMATASDFVAVQLDQNPFDALVSTRCLPDWFLTITQAAERYHGFLAGGFARVIATNLLVPNVKDDNFRSSVWHWVYSYMKVNEVVNPNNHWDFKTRADADFFFESPSNIKGFINELVERGLEVSTVGTTPSGMATEYMVNQSLKMQVISGRCGTFEQVLSDFDIVNAMVAVTSDKIVYPGQRWLDLEQKQTLHVDNWRSDYTIFRIMKWMDRHGVVLLTDETAQAAMDATLRLLSAAKHNGGMVPAACPNGYATRTFMLSRKFKELMWQRKDKLSNQDLLWLASVWPDDLKAYNAAFAVLKERSALDWTKTT